MQYTYVLRHTHQHAFHTYLLYERRHWFHDTIIQDNISTRWWYRAAVLSMTWHHTKQVNERTWHTIPGTESYATLAHKGPHYFVPGTYIYDAYLCTRAETLFCSCRVSTLKKSRYLKPVRVLVRDSRCRAHHTTAAVILYFLYLYIYTLSYMFKYIDVFFVFRVRRFFTQQAPLDPDLMWKFFAKGTSLVRQQAGI